MLPRETEERTAPLQAAHAADSIRPVITADLRALFGRSRLEEKVPRWLEPGESVLALAFGTHAGRWWQEARAMNIRLIVATDRRLRLLPNDLLMAHDLAGEARAPEPESLPYGEMQGIEEKFGLTESKLDILMHTGTVRLTSMRVKGASAVAEVVRAHI